MTDALNCVFQPRLPRTRSISPSLSRSSAAIDCHSPPELGGIHAAEASLNFLPSFKKTFTGIQSPVRMRSGNLLLSRSAHTAADTMPTLFNAGNHLELPSINIPLPSLTKI